MLLPSESASALFYQASELTMLPTAVMVALTFLAAPTSPSTRAARFALCTPPSRLPSSPTSAPPAWSRSTCPRRHPPRTQTRLRRPRRTRSTSALARVRTRAKRPPTGLMPRATAMGNAPARRPRQAGSTSALVRVRTRAKRPLTGLIPRTTAMGSAPAAGSDPWSAPF